MSTHPAVRAFLRAPSGTAAALALLLIAVIAVVAPMLLGDSAARLDIMRSGKPPGTDYLLGTDALGRPILSRVLVATGLSVSLALGATLIAASTGVAAGIGVALLGPRWRPLGLRTIDVILSFPGILLAIVITAFIGIGIESAVVAIGLAYAPDFARLASTLAISVTGRDYVTAAGTLGVSRRHLLQRYILPNIGEAMIVAIFATSAGTLIAVSSLSFLGLGVQPPHYDWGRLLVDGIDAFYVTPAAALAPAAAIAFTGLALGFFGEALARATNPLLWTPADDAARPRNAQAASRTLPDAPPRTDTGAPWVLDVRDLVVRYPDARGQPMRVIDGVSLQLRAGEVVGVVGESGSGKSQTAMAIAELLQPPADVSCARHHFAGHDLTTMPDADRRRLLGTRLALVFQDPMTSLNPTLRVGEQVAEPGFLFGVHSRREALAMAVQRLDEVGIPTPAERMRAYPHQFSGGMQQRAMIAMGLMNEPALLIADEPTTALDVTIQAQVVELLQNINRRHGTAILLITHNLGVVATMAHRVVVMYAGRIVEDVPVSSLPGAAAHPYTRLLLAAMPRLDGAVDAPLAAIDGHPPTADQRPAGCAFAPRCPHAQPPCQRDRPALRPLGPVSAGHHQVACHFPVQP